MKSLVYWISPLGNKFSLSVIVLLVRLIILFEWFIFGQNFMAVSINTKPAIHQSNPTTFIKIYVQHIFCLLSFIQWIMWVYCSRFFYSVCSPSPKGNKIDVEIFILCFELCHPPQLLRDILCQEPFWFCCLCFSRVWKRPTYLTVLHHCTALSL